MVVAQEPAARQGQQPVEDGRPQGQELLAHARRRGTSDATLLRNPTQENQMASESSNSSIVAIFAIVMILAIGALVGWRMGLFGGSGGGDKGHGIDVNVR